MNVKIDTIKKVFLIIFIKINLEFKYFIKFSENDIKIRKTPKSITTKKLISISESKYISIDESIMR